MIDSGITVGEHGRRNLDPMQFKLPVGREYELASRSMAEIGLQNQVVKVTTRKTEEVVAKEYDISPRTVRLSADLYKTIEAIKKAAPEVAEKLEFVEIKVSCKDIVVIGKPSNKLIPRRKGRLSRI